jgi:hypothetical protein
MKLLFNYRREDKIITTNDGDKQVKVIRQGPMGIVARVKGVGRVVIWGKEDFSTHVNDSEETLLQKLIDVLDA